MDLTLTLPTKTNNGIIVSKLRDKIWDQTKVLHFIIPYKNLCSEYIDSTIAVGGLFISTYKP